MAAIKPDIMWIKFIVDCDQWRKGDVSCQCTAKAQALVDKKRAEACDAPKHGHVRTLAETATAPPVAETADVTPVDAVPPLRRGRPRTTLQVTHGTDDNN